MEFFVGNIDVNNMSILDDASNNSSVQFRQGTYMTFSFNNKKHHDFYPIFCATKDHAIQLLKVYLDIAKSKKATNNFDNDSYMISENEIIHF